LIKRVVSRRRHVHGIRLFAQALGYESRNPRIIFNQQ
jgi:hypothetical protein